MACKVTPFDKIPALQPILVTTEVELALANTIESFRDLPTAHWLKKPEPKASPAPVLSTTFTSSYMPARTIVLLSVTITPFGRAQVAITVELIHPG